MTFCSGYSDRQNLSVRILDATNADPHPQAEHPQIETSSMGARQLQIAGDYLGILSDSANNFLPEFRLYNWKTGERLMVRGAEKRLKTRPHSLTVTVRHGIRKLRVVGRTLRHSTS